MKVECNLFPFVPNEIRLFHNREKCAAWCEKKFGTRPMMMNSSAQTIMWNGVGIVLFEVEPEPDPTWENALLVHEAYHMVCQHLRDIKEDEAGEETVAYMIQCVAGALMEAHCEWRKSHVCVEG